MPEQFAPTMHTVQTQDVKYGDELYVGGLHVSIQQIIVNDHDELVFTFDIMGTRIKQRSKMMLIIPKNLPMTILNEKEQED